MLYAILAYHVEAEVVSWTKQEDERVMSNLQKAHARLNQEGRLGPKEQLLGLYVLDYPDDDAAVEAVRELHRANPSAVYEIRPIALYLPGQVIPRTESPTDVVRPKAE
jgi:hypothetical protein